MSSVHRCWFAAKRPFPIHYTCSGVSAYCNHHPHIVPKNFSDLQVEQGGYGAGTIITFRVKVGGLTRSMRQQITEPEPGRVLVEATIGRDEATTFTVTPRGTGCTVQIATRFAASKGLEGLVERLMAPRLLRPLYYQELDTLSRYAAQQV